MAQGKITINEFTNELSDLITNKVDKVNGMGLSSNDYTTNDKNTLDSVKKDLDGLKDQVSQNKPIVINDDTPIGTIMFRDKSATIAGNWLLCDGRVISKTEYPDLFTVLGYTHGGSGDSFNLPDLNIGNLLIEGINDAETEIDAKIIKNQIGIIKAKNVNADTISGVQDWITFKENGGHINGPIKGVSGSLGHRLFEHVGVFNSRNALIRTGSGNFNGYPSWSYIIEDIDTDVNSNGLVFMLGDGTSGNRDNYLRTWKAGSNSTQKNNIGSSGHPWDDIWLVGFSKSANGYTKLPNGIILQWGTNTGALDVVGGKVSKTVNFPITFPTLCVTTNVTCCRNVTSNDGAYVDHMAGSTSYVNTTNFVANVRSIGTGTPKNTFEFRWLAIGY